MNHFKFLEKMNFPIELLHPNTLLGKYAFEELKNDTPREKLKVELKVLPFHHKYVFLEADDVKPVVINNVMSIVEESAVGGGA